MATHLVIDELDLLHRLVHLDQHRKIIELGCGAADLARKLLARFPCCELAGLEVDERQHAKNLLNPAPGLQFIQAGAQSIPFSAGMFDLALMLKSLHHVPLLTQLMYVVGEGAKCAVCAVWSRARGVRGDGCVFGR